MILTFNNIINILILLEVETRGSLATVSLN
jgi:hypothetical protein